MVRELIIFAIIGVGLGFVPVQSQTLESTLNGCVQCHGPVGVSQIAAIPHLDRQLPAAIEEAMAAYAEARRATSISQHKELPRELFAAVANFYSVQKNGSRPRQIVDTAKVEQGEIVYSRKCAKCHDDSGRESDNDAPLLAGQNLEYLVKEVLAFKDGSRKQPSMMERSYRGLSEEELVAVAHYFASQDPVSPVEAKKKRRRSGS